MINLIRSLFPRRLDAETLAFLVKCLEKLPPETYGPFCQQLNEGLVRYVGTSEIEDPRFRNYVNFTYEPKVSVRFQVMNGRFWRVDGISVENRNHTEKTNVAIFFSHGLVCGYAFENRLSFDPDPNSIDVSNARLEFIDGPDPIARRLISDRDQQLINWSDVYEVELEGTTYLHLREIGDGDFLGMDGNGRFYEIRHDPFEVIGIDGPLEKILISYEDLF